MSILEEGRIFADRREAGFELGKLLESKYKDVNALVLGIPRGGIVIAYEVAKVLNAEMSVVITKKLPHPSHEEYAVGAAAEDGSVFLTSAARSLTNDDVQRGSVSGNQKPHQTISKRQIIARYV